MSSKKRVLLTCTPFPFKWRIVIIQGDYILQKLTAVDQFNSIVDVLLDSQIFSNRFTEKSDHSYWNSRNRNLQWPFVTSQLITRNVWVLCVVRGPLGRRMVTNDN